MPVFWILVILGAIAAWFLLATAFIPLGRFLRKIFKRSEDALAYEEEDMKGDVQDESNR